MNEQLKRDFRYMIKQRGGMLAKGWLLGLQFLSLFEDDQYRKIAAHANAMAQKLQKHLLIVGIHYLPNHPRIRYLSFYRTRLSKIRKTICVSVLGKGRCYTYSNAFCHELGDT